MASEVGWNSPVFITTNKAKKCQCSSTTSRSLGMYPRPITHLGSVGRACQGLANQRHAGRARAEWAKGCAGFIASCGVCQFHISTAPAGAAYPDGIPVCRWGDELMMAEQTIRKTGSKIGEPAQWYQIVLIGKKYGKRAARVPRMARSGAPCEMTPSSGFEVAGL